jgi:hypothetical protein
MKNHRLHSVFLLLEAALLAGMGSVAAESDALTLPDRSRVLAAAATESGRDAPQVVVREASLLQFRGANSPTAAQPGDTDCNSPSHWDGNVLYLFNSAGHPWRSAGPDLAHLDRGYIRCEYNNKANGGRWIECTWKADDAWLYGWYHNEPGGLCPGTTLTAPKIGAARSANNGATWEDLGIILEAPAGTLRCQTKNFYFAGGNGDFSAIPDPRREYLYFFISTYTGELSEQGVAVARMRYADRDQPTGKVLKWRAGGWTEPGLGGRVTAIYPADTDWHQADAAAFWGPSIHWNSYLQSYVLLLNRTKDSNWSQEGVYVSFNPDLEHPDEWTKPTRILPSQGNDRWYPQVFGTDSSRHETDKLAGRTARLFLRGQSQWEVEFVK